MGRKKGFCEEFPSETEERGPVILHVWLAVSSSSRNMLEMKSSGPPRAAEAGPLGVWPTGCAPPGDHVGPASCEDTKSRARAPESDVLGRVRPPPVLAVRLWANGLIFLCLSFPVCNYLDRIIVSHNC